MEPLPIPGKLYKIKSVYKNGIIYFYEVTKTDDKYSIAVGDPFNFDYNNNYFIFIGIKALYFSNNYTPLTSIWFMQNKYVYTNTIKPVFELV